MHPCHTGQCCSNTVAAPNTLSAADTTIDATADTNVDATADNTADAAADTTAADC